jgi:cell division septation protein DedD
MSIPEHETGSRGALSGRAVAIAVLAVVSAACFGLGFFVGREISRGQLREAGLTAPMEEAALPGLAPAETVVETPPESTAPAGTDEAPGEPASSEGAKTYSVQVGAYLNGKTAETLAARLRNKGYEAYILKTATPDSRTLYKVRVGRFADKADAELMARRLEKVAAGESIITGN